MLLGIKIHFEILVFVQGVQYDFCGTICYLTNILSTNNGVLYLLDYH